jgi:ATP-dependent Clp protease ATP-binding subunit ClpA
MTPEELKAIADKAAADKAIDDKVLADKAAADAAAAAEPKHEATVPYERLQAVIQERDALKKEKDAATEKARLATEAEQKKQGQWQALAETKDRELAAAKEALKSSALRQATLVAAMAGNAVDPDAVWALLDKSTLATTDDGTPTGVQEAVQKLLTTKPYLVKQATPGYPMGAGGTGGSLTTEEIGKLTPAQYREWRAKHPDA